MYFKSYMGRPGAGVESALKNNFRYFLSMLASSMNMDEKDLVKYLSKMTEAEINSLIVQFNVFRMDMEPNTMPYPPQLVKNELDMYIKSSE
mgnify:FL=1